MEGEYPEPGGGEQALGGVLHAQHVRVERDDARLAQTRLVRVVDRQVVQSARDLRRAEGVRRREVRLAGKRIAEDVDEERDAVGGGRQRPAVALRHHVGEGEVDPRLHRRGRAGHPGAQHGDGAGRAEPRPAGGAEARYVVQDAEVGLGEVEAVLVRGGGGGGRTACLQLREEQLDDSAPRHAAAQLHGLVGAVPHDRQRRLQHGQPGGGYGGTIKMCWKIITQFCENYNAIFEKLCYFGKL